ncbi:hypothetical protein [Rubrivirga sp. IMCC45206]|uniref:hypothetical protein n=1 Tax=Rubrivirga sp. IMCC45206 TaxID=3391614 RepID=UPI00398FD8B6
MNERLLARLLFGLGMLSVSLMLLFDFHWSTSGTLARVSFVGFTSAATMGVALDIKHRREEKRLQRGSGGGPV